MKYKIIEHLAGTSKLPDEAEFDTLEELQNVPFVRWFVESSLFARLSVYSATCGDQLVKHCLICEVTNGRWYTVGYLSTINGLDLPRWTMGASCGMNLKTCTPVLYLWVDDEGNLREAGPFVALNRIAAYDPNPCFDTKRIRDDLLAGYKDNNVPHPLNT